MRDICQENKMGVMRVDKLLLSMSTPMIISMMVQALYNIVDSIFVSRISEDALTAVSICFPIQNLMIACSVGTNIGVNSLLSKSLGERDFDKATKVANSAIVLSIMMSFIFLIFGFFFTEEFFSNQDVNAQIKKYGIEYMKVVCICTPLFLQVCTEKLLNSTGKTVYTMITQISGALVNIILDPIFIFHLNLGVKGAAIATIIGHIVGMAIGLYFNYMKNKELHINIKKFEFDIDIIKKIYSVGFPSIIMKSAASLTIFGFNVILMTFSSTVVAFFGIYFKLQSFIILPIFGLSNGLIPIVAYNYGAKKKDRIISCMKYSFLYSGIITFFGVFAMQVFPSQLLYMFKASDDMVQIGIPALRIISVSYIFACFSITMSAMFQALGSGISSMIISLIRQIVILPILVYIFSMLRNLNLLWSSICISEIFAFIMCIVFAKTIIKKIDI